MRSIKSAICALVIASVECGMQKRVSNETHHSGQFARRCSHHEICSREIGCSSNRITSYVGVRSAKPSERNIVHFKRRVSRLHLTAPQSRCWGQPVPLLSYCFCTAPRKSARFAPNAQNSLERATCRQWPVRSGRSAELSMDCAARSPQAQLWQCVSIVPYAQQVWVCVRVR